MGKAEGLPTVLVECHHAIVSNRSTNVHPLLVSVVEEVGQDQSVDTVVVVKHLPPRSD